MRIFRPACLFHIVATLLACGLISSCSIIDEIKVQFRKQEAIETYNKSVDYVNSQKFRLAYPLLLRAHELDPENNFVNHALGKTLIGLGKADMALPYLNKARTDPSDPGVFLTLGTAYESLGQFGKAAEAFENYLKARPDDHKKETLELIKSLRKQQATYEKISKLAGGHSETDYYAYATAEAGVRRWHHKKMPLKIYIEEGKDIKGHQPHFKDLVLKACDEWEKGSHGTVKIRHSKSPRQAHIRCRFYDDPSKLGSSREQGQTISSYDLNGLRESSIKILTVDRDTGKEQTDQLIYQTSLHEIGHALGIDGHSPKSGDIMFFSEFDRDLDSKVSLSARDLQTLNKIYSSKTAYIPPKGSSKEREVERIRAYNEHIKIYNAAVADYNAGRYAEAIDKANSYLQLEPGSKQAKSLISNAKKHLSGN